jgi:8-oxo-dGTP diphosphatase
MMAQIQAAGGLIWRNTPQGKQIAIIFRNRYQDWTLPKGKMIPGESWTETALRETFEETGYKTHIIGFAGAIGYQVKDQDKVVRFWHMKTEGQPSRDLDTEVNRVEWLSVEEALHRLDYPLEQALLEAWASEVDGIL